MAMGYLFKTIRSGTMKPAGIVDIPFLGAKVGEFSNWSLERRGDSGPEMGLYDLRAVFAFISAALWEDPDYEKQIILNLNPFRSYRVIRQPDMRMVLSDRSLLIEGVTIVSTR
jgi:hypothetical protein